MIIAILVFFSLLILLLLKHIQNKNKRLKQEKDKVEKELSKRIDVLAYAIEGFGIIRHDLQNLQNTKLICKFFSTFF